MLIKVTQEDIDLGVGLMAAYNCNYRDQCPIALAISRTINTNVSVDKEFIIIGERMPRYTPPSAREFITKYDRCKTRVLARPFEFELDI